MSQESVKLDDLNSLETAREAFLRDCQEVFPEETTFEIDGRVKREARVERLRLGLPALPDGMDGRPTFDAEPACRTATARFVIDIFDDDGNARHAEMEQDKAAALAICKICK